MAEIMEVEICQACRITGPIKAMPHIVPPMPRRIVEYPRHVRRVRS